MKRPFKTTTTTTTTTTASEAAIHRQLTSQEQQQLSADFRELMRSTAPLGHHHFTVSSLSCNYYKNRYTDVKPSDHTRVKLQPLPNDPGSDYINASFIREKIYISCQAPLEATIPDFWRMVWETKATTIVMLTNLSERGTVKANIYWPQVEGNHFEYAGIEISLKKLKVIGGINARTFCVSKIDLDSQQRECRTVIQYHYTQWPDQGTPSSTADICHLLDLVYDGKASGSGPTIVHCSAGIGRAGTFIAADMLIKRMKALMEDLQKKKDEGNRGVEFGETSISLTPLRLLKRIVEKIREDRRGMVQTEEQYKFIYQIFKDKLSSQWQRVYQLQRLERYEEESGEGMFEKSSCLEIPVSSSSPGLFIPKRISLDHSPLPVSSPPIDARA